MRACVRACTCACLRARARACERVCVYESVVRSRACVRACVRVDVRACACVRSRACVCVYVRACVRACLGRGGDSRPRTLGVWKPAARRPSGPVARWPGGPAARRPGGPAARRPGGPARQPGRRSGGGSGTAVSEVVQDPSRISESQQRLSPRSTSAHATFAYPLQPSSLLSEKGCSLPARPVGRPKIMKPTSERSAVTVSSVKVGRWQKC
jgi:hypothetical protein